MLTLAALRVPPLLVEPAFKVVLETTVPGCSGCPGSRRWR